MTHRQRSMAVSESSTAPRPPETGEGPPRDRPDGVIYPRKCRNESCNTPGGAGNTRA
jgi:hypothetical protein